MKTHLTRPGTHQRYCNVIWSDLEGISQPGNKPLSPGQYIDGICKECIASHAATLRAWAESL